MKDNVVYLKHILEAIRKIEKFLGELSFNEFAKDEKTMSAVVRELEIVGEAANNLDSSFKENYPEIPFRNMIEMRNFLIHEYFGVNRKIVWDTCKEDIPRLKEIIKNTLNS